MVDLIGKIAIIKPPLNKPLQEIIKEIISKHKYIKTILLQKTDALPPYRIPIYEIVYGDNNTETICKEYGLKFKLDVSKTYYSPRLSNERLRIANLVQQGERVLVMFAGINPYSIYIAKFSEPEVVYSIEWNPYAVKYGIENVILNKVENKVKTILGDVRLATKLISFMEDRTGIVLFNAYYLKEVQEIESYLNKLIFTKEYSIKSIKDIFDTKKKKLYRIKEEHQDKIVLEDSDYQEITIKKYDFEFDRIIMPLPKEAGIFLEYAVPLIKEGGIIHLYHFLHEKEINKEYINKLIRVYEEKYNFKSKILNIIKTGDIAPRQYRVCIDLKIEKKFN